MNNKLIERIDDYLKNYLGADLARQILRDCKKALEAKPVGEVVAWMNPDGSLTPYHKLGEEQEPLYTALPSIDELIAEIDGLERYGMVGDYDFYIDELSDGPYVCYSKLKAILDKWRTK